MANTKTFRRIMLAEELNYGDKAIYAILFAMNSGYEVHGLTQCDICNLVGMKLNTLKKHIKTLRELGIVKVGKEPMNSSYTRNNVYILPDF